MRLGVILESSIGCSFGRGLPAPTVTSHGNVGGRAITKRLKRPTRSMRLTQMVAND